MTVHSNPLAAPLSDAPAQPLLEIRNLQISVRGGAELLHGIDLTLPAGTIGALVGESGSGKTLAARSILKLLPPGLEITGGRIDVGGDDIVAADQRRMRELRGASIGMVFQEPMASLNPAMTIGAQMAEAMRLHTKLSRAEIREQAIAMLSRVRMRDPESALAAYPHEFSGGMRQRILLASVMLLKPKLLVADEPTTALDNLSQREVLDIMVELARDTGTAVLLITHNLGLVSRYTNTTTVLRSGRVVEHGDTAAIISSPSDPYTEELIEAAMRVDLPSIATSQIGLRSALIEASDLSVEFRDRASGKPFNAVDHVDLTVRSGETLAIVGGSGSGKTTLGRALLGLIRPKTGEVRFEGEPLFDGKTVRRRARLACQFVFQDPYSSLDPRFRVGEIVAEPLRHVDGMDGRKKAETTAQILEEVGLAGFEKRFPHQLSGGQRQRVAIARALVRRPSVVVADEAVSALDMTIQAQILDLLRDLQARLGFACIFISHDLTAVRRLAHRLVVMENGHIVEEGTASDVLDRPQHDYTQALIDAAPAIIR